MPRRFVVESREGRLTFAKGGSTSPNRISHFFSQLSSEWLTPHQRPHVQLPAPVGGWIRYALTLTPHVVYARCQGYDGTVQERMFRSPTECDESNLVSTRVDHFFHAFNGVYRMGLERAYGWPRTHHLLPAYLPVLCGKSILEEFYMRYGSLSLILGPRHILLTGWGAGLSRISGPVSANAMPCTSQTFILPHGLRWRGISDDQVETLTLLKQAAKILSATWPLTGRESE